MVAVGRGGGLCVKGELEGVERVWIVNRRGGEQRKYICVLCTHVDFMYWKTVLLLIQHFIAGFSFI